MKRIFFICIFILMVSFNIAHAENFEVLEICEDQTSAVLLDRESKAQLSVNVGDRIGEWEVIEIDELGVTIKKEPEDDKSFAIVHKLEKISTHGISFER
jgi:hypothetical protein